MLLDDDDAGLTKRLSTITDLGLKSSGSFFKVQLAGRGIIEGRSANRGVVRAPSGGAGRAMLKYACTCTQLLQHLATTTPLM